MLVHQCHLNADQKRQLLLRIDFTEREWLTQYYKGIFEVNENSGIVGMSENPSATPHIVPVGLTTRVPTESSVSGLLRRAQYLLANSQQSSEAYRLARLAYIKDPYNMHAVLVFISCLVELSLAPELFYLGHELTSHNPKQAVPWYAVGCYYWCCRKLDLAQKYLMKCTKIDKRFAPGFVMLGHVLGAQEEREHAVSALRTACRLLPGDHRPLVLMAKELMKMNCVSLALHLLSGASEIAQNDPVLLNELGVAFLRLDRTEDALEYLSLSVRSLHRGVSGTNPGIGESFKEEDEVVRAGSRCTSGAEIYSNYATALRRTGLWERALQWYSLSVAEDPTDHDTHAAIGFTYHLLRRYVSLPLNF